MSNYILSYTAGTAGDVEEEFETLQEALDAAPEDVPSFLDCESPWGWEIHDASGQLVADDAGLYVTLMPKSIHSQGVAHMTAGRLTFNLIELDGIELVEIRANGELVSHFHVTDPIEVATHP